VNFILLLLDSKQLLKPTILENTYYVMRRIKNLVPGHFPLHPTGDAFVPESANAG
jgi:hypothetical protein